MVTVLVLSVTLRIRLEWSAVMKYEPDGCAASVKGHITIALVPTPSIAPPCQKICCCVLVWHENDAVFRPATVVTAPAGVTCRMTARDDTAEVRVRRAPKWRG